MYIYFMQPTRTITRFLRMEPSARERIFAAADLRALVPGIGDGAFRSVLARLEKSGELLRVCRGIYLLPGALFAADEILLRTACRLRPHHFNYISLETALSDAGILSQVPLSRLTLMSTGRSNVISCGDRGVIEFVHTRRSPASLATDVVYDPSVRCFRATVSRALADMRRARRNTGLVDEATHNVEE